MSVLLMLVPIATFMGLMALVAFMWSLRNGQYDDLDGAAHRAIMDDDEHLIPGREPPAGRSSLHTQL